MKVRSLLEPVGVALLFALPYYSPADFAGASGSVSSRASHSPSNRRPNVGHGRWRNSRRFSCLSVGAHQSSCAQVYKSATVLSALSLGESSRLQSLSFKVGIHPKVNDLIVTDPSFETAAWFTSYGAHHVLFTGLIVGAPYSLFTIILPKSSSFLIRATRLFVAAFALCAVWVMPELIYFAISLPSDSGFERSASETKAPSERIVWILFDELSYDLTVVHPPDGQSYFL